MRKLTVILGQNVEVEGLNLNTNLKGFRNQLKKRNFTEVNTIYRAGKHVVTFLTEDMSRLQLIDTGLIKGSKEERKQYIEKTKSIKARVDNFGYAW